MAGLTGVGPFTLGKRFSVASIANASSPKKLYTTNMSNGDDYNWIRIKIRACLRKTGEVVEQRVEVV